MKNPVLATLIVLALAGVSFSAPPGVMPKWETFDGTLKDDQGEVIIHYAGLVPPSLPTHKTMGLILGLHGRGGDENQQLTAISMALAANDLAGQYVILGLKSKGDSWGDADDEPVSKAIAWAIKEYPIEPRRVYAWGFSSGGFFTGKFGPSHPELLAGGVIQSGGVGNLPKADEGVEPPVQLYVIHAEKDEKVDVKTAHESCEHLAAANYRFVYHELTGDEHALKGPGAYPARQDAVRFLNSLRNRVIPLSESEKKVVGDLTTKLKQGRANPPASAFVPLLELAGPETDAAILLALQSLKPDIRINGTALCAQRLYGNAVLSALPARLKDKEAKVRTYAIRGLGLAANFQHKDAVEVLAALANDPTAKIDDRINAAGQLGITLPLQFYCVNHDKPLFKAMTNLLDDKDEQLKELAQVSLDGKLTFDGQAYHVEK